jgi:predicted AAA+ superfamily ATPase
MPRADLKIRLDGAIGQSRITLVQGLPRVGRTEAVKRWVGGRPDAVIQPFGSGEDIAPVMVFDHFRAEQVDAFVTHFRVAEAAEARTRFLIVPTDLMTADRVCDALAGSVFRFDMAPLQLDDFLAEQSVLSVAGGPSAELVAESRPTNSPAPDRDHHWLRGGLPESLSADGDAASLAWRRGMLGTLLARDYTTWGVPRASRLPDILRWVANQNGGELDDTSCPVAKRADLRPALYVLERLGVIRSLPNFPAGSSSSLGKKPKLYIRDSGLLHAMLGIETIAQLRDHADAGDSWEGYAIETLILAGADQCSAQFYRVKGTEGEGADEIDLVLDFVSRGARRIAIECKLSPDQGARVGFYRACEEIGATDRFVVHSGTTAALDGAVHRLDLPSAVRRIQQIAVGR